MERRAMALPPGAGYASIRAVLRPRALGVQAEAGWRPRANLALYGFGSYDTMYGPMAGIGARLNF